MTNVLFIRDTLYRLKQDYGQRMDLYVPNKSDVDYNKGTQSVTRKYYSISKVILLPEILQRRQFHEVGLAAAGRQFAFGGLMDDGERTIILDSRDIPKGVKLNSTCYMIYEHVRYDLGKIEELEHRCGFIMSMNRINTSLSLEIVDLRAESVLQFAQEVINA